MSKSEDLSQLHELYYELSKVEQCKNNIKALLDQTNDNQTAANAGTNEAEERERRCVNHELGRVRSAIFTVLQIITTLMMLAATAYSFYIYIPAMKATTYVMAGIVFFGVVHGIVCLALIIFANIFIGALKN